ncbi:MAG: 2-methylthioadenine synthetase [Candidatus Micrarchaeota archaeon]|nr:MAG: 2-methylthioadenine synthetase [Candidatus Micrarchaeota archaeon]
MKVAIETYGCTLNQADSDIIRSILENNGIEITEDGEDVRIINTCTVKSTTEQKILNRIRTLRSKKLIVTGCMASANKDLILKAAPKASILTASNIADIADAVRSVYNGKQIIKDSIKIDDRISYLEPRGVIARIPISEGCLSNCSFCETKLARGPLHSFDISLIRKAVEISLRNGAKEIQLTAQDVGAYGRDKGTNIAKLVEDISQIDGNFMIRIGMMNPEHIHLYIDELIEQYRSNSKLYHFIHLPLQSGSDRILKLMKRRYSYDDYKSYIKELKDKVPDITIETDMIVGFPTESEEDFNRSIEAIKEIRFDVINVSRYSVRPHTEASMMRNIRTEIIKERSIIMSRIVREIEAERNLEYVNKNVLALITEKSSNCYKGRTYNYKQLVIDNERVKLGDTVVANIISANSTSLFGKIL